MRIRWTPAAAADLEHISNYLKDRYPHYCQPTLRKLYEAIRSLKESPHRGRLGREDGTRDFVPSHALYCRVPREGEYDRSLADLPRCSGPALRHKLPRANALRARCPRPPGFKF